MKLLDLHVIATAAVWLPYLCRAIAKICDIFIVQDAAYFCVSSVHGLSHADIA